MQGETVGILVGGGPAPGINGVIASATMEAIRNGLRVVGIYDGYAHLVRGDASKTVTLEIEDVIQIAGTGGSILRTSRTNPAADEATLQQCVRTLETLDVRYLVTIGGDDTTYGATRIAEATGGRISVAAVPKTIDNDLPLPDDAPTFGFETARSVAAGIVASLIRDARTTQRWYLAVSMGRKSGLLALGMSRAAGAHLAVLAEDFSENEIELNAVVDTIVGSIVKRLRCGFSDGVVVVAEGIAERLSPKALEAFANLARDSYGHVRLADIPLGALLRDGVRRRLDEIGVRTTVVTKDIGYELRCADPVPFDVDYTRSLGYGAVRYLLDGGSGALMALSGGRVIPVELAALQDPQTGRVRVRMVDTSAESYRIARASMTLLEADDFAEPKLSALAALTNLDAAEFSRAFANTVRGSLVPSKGSGR